jgi:hypothetical protein
MATAFLAWQVLRIEIENYIYYEEADISVSCKEK